MNFILNPKDIENKSFEIISSELGKKKLIKENANVIKRVIHTTADFDYADNLIFSKNAVQKAKKILENGVNVVTDTKMAMSGINKKSLAKINGTINCFIDSSEVATIAKEKNITRSQVAIEYAIKKLKNPIVFVIGNAPTALIKLHEVIKNTDFKPDLIIATPVGFVNVVESKELIMELDIPFIVSKGRKGGSNVAAAICNALIYEIIRV